MRKRFHFKTNKNYNTYALYITNHNQIVYYALICMSIIKLLCPDEKFQEKKECSVFIGVRYWQH